MPETKIRDPFRPDFEPAHITALYAEYASDREELPGDWPCEIVRRAAKLLKAYAEAATKGPWRSCGSRPCSTSDRPIVPSGFGNVRSPAPSATS